MMIDNNVLHLISVLLVKLNEGFCFGDSGYMFFMKLQKSMAKEKF